MNMKANATLVQRLKEQQGERTQAEFAKFLGISRSTLSRLYSGERRVGLETLRRIGERYPNLVSLFLSESVSLINTNVSKDDIETQQVGLDERLTQSVAGERSDHER